MPHPKLASVRQRYHYACGYRLVHRIQTVLREKQLLLERQNEELRKTIEAQERYIAMLEAQLKELN